MREREELADVIGSVRSASNALRHRADPRPAARQCMRIAAGERDLAEHGGEHACSCPRPFGPISAWIVPAVTASDDVVDDDPVLAAHRDVLELDRDRLVTSLHVASDERLDQRLGVLGTSRSRTSSGVYAPTATWLMM